MKNIVVGIDFSPSSENALKHAIAVAIKAKATIHLVYVKPQKSTSAIEKAELEGLLQKAVKRLAELY